MTAQTASKFPGETGPNELKIGRHASLASTWTGTSPVLEHYGDTIFPSLSDQTRMDIVHQFEDVRQRLRSHLAGSSRHRHQESKDSVQSIVSRLRASSAGSRSTAPSDSSYQRSFSPSSCTSSLSTPPTSAASSTGRPWDVESKKSSGQQQAAPITNATITDVGSLSAGDYSDLSFNPPPSTRRTSIESSNSWYDWVFETFGDKRSPAIPESSQESPDSFCLPARKPSSASLSSSAYSRPERDSPSTGFGTLDNTAPDSAASWGIDSSPWASDDPESLPYARVPQPLKVKFSPVTSSPGLSSYQSVSSMSRLSHQAQPPQHHSMPTTKKRLKSVPKISERSPPETEPAEEGPTASYFCTTGGCKKLHSVNTFASYLRHERSHWIRYPCPLCSPSSLLKSITCNCADSPSPIGYHLERHRHDFREQNLCSRSFIRKDKLRMHLTKPRMRGGHHLSATQARNMIEDSAFAIRKVTACGLCDDPTLFYSYETAAQHFWTHWQREKLKITHWSEARVVRKLIASRPQMQKTWNVVASLCGVDPDLGTVQWQHTQARDLRFELEAGQKSFSELAWMAFEMADKGDSVRFALPEWTVGEGYETMGEDDREALSPSPLVWRDRDRHQNHQQHREMWQRTPSPSLSWSPAPMPALDRSKEGLGLSRRSHVASMVRRVESIPHIPPPVPPKGKYERIAPRY